MSEQSSHQGPGPSRKFLPEVKSLETRILLSTAIPHKDGIVWHPDPPRTGGIAVQSGSVLSRFVGQPKMNAVQVTVDGTGHVEMSWNLGQPHVFPGVTTTVIQAERARTDQFTLHLAGGNGNDTFSARAEAAQSTFQDPGLSTGSTGIDLVSHRPADAVSGHVDGHARDDAPFVRANGPILNVIVNRPRTNVVQVNNEGGGDVQVEWNGGMAHAFTGVETIVVETHNATKDQVTLNDSIP
jgi:hypothetical protein